MEKTVNTLEAGDIIYVMDPWYFKHAEHTIECIHENDNYIHLIANGILYTHHKNWDNKKELINGSTSSYHIFINWEDLKAAMAKKLEQFTDNIDERIADLTKKYEYEVAELQRAKVHREKCVKEAKEIYSI